MKQFDFQIRIVVTVAKSVMMCEVLVTGPFDRVSRYRLTVSQYGFKACVCESGCDFVRFDNTRCEVLHTSEYLTTQDAVPHNARHTFGECNASVLTAKPSDYFFPKASRSATSNRTPDTRNRFTNVECVHD